jgi:hypothetical protein
MIMGSELEKAGASNIERFGMLKFIDLKTM